MNDCNCGNDGDGNHDNLYLSYFIYVISYMNLLILFDKILMVYFGMLQNMDLLC